MERSEYERLASVEQHMWWFRGLHAVLALAWRRAAGTPARAILDAGCGTGGLLLRLAEQVPAALLCGLELDVGAGSMARVRSGQPVCIGSVNHLPFAEDTLDAIFSADVLCHRGVDEAATLAGFRRCLRSGGVLVLNLPAYRWLFSSHDRAVDNVRRYTRSEVTRLLTTAGFTGIRAGYWNTFLFPLMVLRRRPWRRSSARPASDVALLPAPVERLFRAIMTIESLLLQAGLRLPFGGSVLASAVKP